MERMNQYPEVNVRHFWVSFLLTILTLLMIVSCAVTPMQKSPAKGIYHIVKKGETAYSIARAYSIRSADLMAINNISDVSSIKEGSVIFIPDADQVIDDVVISTKKADSDAKRNIGLNDQKLPDRTKPSKPVDVPRLEGKTPPDKPVSSEPSVVRPEVVPSGPVVEKTGPRIEEKIPRTEKKDEVKQEKDKLFWPVRGTVQTRFGVQPNKPFHNNSWIKIVCPVGTKVKAAAKGTVIFSASLKLGETIIIRHSNNFATVYTHLKERYVKQDQNVRKGQVIALVGENDEKGDAYINFEIRYKNKPQDPLLYLP